MVLDFAESWERSEGHQRDTRTRLNRNNVFRSLLSADAEVTHFKRLGKYSTEQEQPRTIIAKVVNEWQKAIILRSLSKLKRFDKSVFVSKENSATDLATENNLLIRRREVITT